MKSRTSTARIEHVYSRAARRAAAQVRSWYAPHSEIARLMRADYRSALNRCLSREQITGILDRARKLWPSLNKTRHRVPSSFERFARVARREGVRLQASPYRGQVGLAMRGFYLDARELGAKRPLIYLNTAHHPAIVALTWIHEMGHHLNREILGGAAPGMHFLIDAGYETHLKDRYELASDLIAVIAAFPLPDLSRLFLTPEVLERIAGPGPLDPAVLERIFGYARKRVGHLELSEVQRRRARDLYIPEAVHFTKLRCALLATYGI
jgi:hypothetical protein